MEPKPKTMRSLILSVVVIACSACDKDEDQPITQIPVPASREITYEVSGLPGGVVHAAYITASGSGASETLDAVPWNKTVTLQDQVPSVTLSVVCSEGVPGNSVRARILLGDTTVREQTTTLDNEGNASIALQPYVLP